VRLQPSLTAGGSRGSPLQNLWSRRLPPSGDYCDILLVLAEPLGFAMVTTVTNSHPSYGSPEG
jgi:hypothetical protein